jgi:hypothetical protein
VSRRGQVEALLDALGWAWNAALSAMLDQAVVEEEGAA